MKGFLGFMAAVFLVLGIVCYNNSTTTVSGLNVANMQMTVFAAACAILCVTNFIGAVILEAIDNNNNNSENLAQKKQTDMKKDDKEHNEVSEKEVIIAKPEDVLFCDICGIRQKKLTRVTVKSKNGNKQQALCDKCLAENSEIII